TLFRSEDLKGKSGQSGFEYSQSAFAKVISEAAKSRGADIILMSATALGRDLAPRVAVKNESAICPDCVDIQDDGGKIIAKKPVFAGKSYIKVQFNSDKVVLTLRPNVFKAEKTDGTAEGEKLDAGSLNVTADDFKSIVKETKVSSEKLDVAEASVIVSGGRGLRGPENWNLIEDLAAVLGAATGASRAVVDAGWRPHAEQ